MKGPDPHTTKAAKIFGVDPKDVTPEQRLIAKQANYVLHYSNPGPFNPERRATPISKFQFPDMATIGSWVKEWKS
jgi:hypothetical protein